MQNTNQADLEYKQKLLDTGLFKRVSEGQYTCQVCPFCGDRKSHMYVMSIYFFTMKKEEKLKLRKAILRCNYGI